MQQGHLILCELESLAPEERQQGTVTWQRSGLTQSKTEQEALILRVAMLHGKQKSRSRLTTGRSPLDHEGLSPSPCTKSVAELDRVSSFVWIHWAETETQIPVTVTSLQQALIQQLSWL